MTLSLSDNNLRDVKPRLHGWDDGSVFYVDEAGERHDLDDYPYLYGVLLDAARDYFKSLPRGDATVTGGA